jgi:hypothetical protein
MASGQPIIVKEYPGAATAMRMRTLKLVMAILVLAGITAASARGGSHGHSHGHFRHAVARPANPSVPPSLTSDPRLTGDAPLPSHRQPRRGSAPAISIKPDPRDVELDRKLRSICRGC